MQLLLWFIQFSLVGIIMFFVTGRLIGTRLSIFKRLIAVGLSVVTTSVVYWFTYIQHNKTFYTPIENESIFISIFIWAASILLITMFFHLVLELFEPISISNQRNASKQNFFMRLLIRWKLQRRLASVFRIAFKHGVGRAFGFWRSAENDRSNARSFRLMLEECDGIFIKFGQMLSTRTDILPESFTNELSVLQENIKPIPQEIIEAKLIKSYGENWRSNFSEFDLTPIASGSIGQVHRATLFEPHQKVVVKILRPEIGELLNKDLDLLINFAAWLTEESDWAENLGFLELAQNFANNMLEEINFELEMRNMEQISNLLKKENSDIRIPKVYTKFSDETIIVMEYFDGVKITEAEEVLERFNKSKEDALAELFSSFLIQVMTTGIFHGDPHPGNIHILKETGQVAMLDFGSVGRIGKSEQQGLTLLFLGYHRNDAKIVVESLRYLVEDDSHLLELSFEQSVSQLLAQISYLEHISTSEVVQSLFDLIQKHHMRLFPMVGVALRALITLEGTIQSVSRDFDAFKQASEFTASKKIITNPIEQAKSLKKIAEEEILLALPVIRALPQRLDQITRNFEKGEMKIKMDFTSNDTNKAFLTKWLSQFMLLLVAITFGGLSIGILATAQYIRSSYIAYLNTAAYIGLFLSLIILVRLSIQVIREYKKIAK